MAFRTMTNSKDSSLKPVLPVQKCFHLNGGSAGNRDRCTWGGGLVHLAEGYTLT